MGLRERKRKKDPQGILPFEYDTSGEVDEMTGRGGLPLVLETLRALEVDKAIAEHVRIRKRDSGFSEAEHVEALVLLMAAGGDCLDDMAVLSADKGLLRLLAKEKLPSADAARQFLLSFHDEKVLADARAKLAPDEKSLVAPESAALRGLGRVVAHLVERVDRHRPAQIATLEMDATIIESHKEEASRTTRVAADTSRR